MNVDNDMLTLYALGHLTPEGEAAVELHLQRHPEDAALVAGYLEALAGLVFELPPEALPEDGEARLLARVRGSTQGYRPPAVIVLPAPDAPLDEARPRAPNVWLGVLAAAAVVVLLSLTVFRLPASNLVAAWQLQRYQNQAGAVSYTLESEGGATRLGTLVRLGAGQVFVALEEPPAAGQVYQAWDIAEAPTSMGTFAGRTFLSEAAIAQGHTFGVTLEPPGGSEQPTSTPITLAEVSR